MMKTWKKIALALSAVLVVACNHDDNILPDKPKKPDAPNPPTQSILPTNLGANISRARLTKIQGMMCFAS